MSLMRWLVEVSSLGKTDLQKFCVEAESWQRALQAARSHRGEDGPMSGFSIELLEEGYRAVDPMARVRFVVRKAPDDMPLTPAPTAKDTKSTGTAPAAPASVKPPPPAASSNGTAIEAATTPALPPSPTSSSPMAGGKKGPPRPGQSTPPPPGTGAAALADTKDTGKKASTMVFGSGPSAIESTDGKTQVDRPPLPAIGSTVAGQPATKLLSSREQNPSDSSPLTYREYAFALPDGTTEEAAADVLRAQLRFVEAHIASAKVGKLVNLAAFDLEFSGKPPKPPLATLTWKDWKGEPVIGYPRRGGAPSAAPRPPSQIPPSALPAMNTGASAPVQVPQAAPVPQVAQPVVASAPPPQAAPQVAPAPPQQVQAQPIPQAPPAPQAQPIPQAQPAPQAQPIPQAPPPQQAAPAQVVPQPPVQTQSQPPPPQRAPSQPAFPLPVPAIVEVEAKRPSQPPGPAGSPGMVKTPSGRFVRGRITGDELITSLFESMHDLHFLRDALDGGQFCLALATEVLPARAALIHFFDIEKREWVVACTRGKETSRLLTMRHPDGDDILRSAARKRRAVVVADATQAASDRYRQIGGARSLIAAPIMQAGRALGALEIINPLDGMPFTDDEGNAMTYIAEQYAEYLGSRGIVLDRERISAAAAR